MQIQGVGLEHPPDRPADAASWFRPGPAPAGEAKLRCPVSRCIRPMLWPTHCRVRASRASWSVIRAVCFFRQRRCVPASQGHVHPPGQHELLKVIEPGIHQLIAAALSQSTPSSLERITLKASARGEDFRDLPALAVPGLLHPEVGVDQQQGLHRQIVQLQVPHGVVGGHMADIRQLPAAEPLVGVVIVQIRHPLPGAAAELADVVADGAAGDQGQVQLHAPRRRARPAVTATWWTPTMCPGSGRASPPGPGASSRIRTPAATDASSGRTGGRRGSPPAPPARGAQSPRRGHSPEAPAPRPAAPAAPTGRTLPGPVGGAASFSGNSSRRAKS